MKYTSFADDEEKMADFYDLTKEEFLRSYSYLTEEEYNLTLNEVGKSIKKEIRITMTTRYDWTDEELEELLYNVLFDRLCNTDDDPQIDFEYIGG